MEVFFDPEEGPWNFSTHFPHGMKSGGGAFAGGRP